MIIEKKAEKTDEGFIGSEILEGKSETETTLDTLNDYKRKTDFYLEDAGQLQITKLDTFAMDPLFLKISTKMDEGGYNGLLVSFLKKNPNSTFEISRNNSEKNAEFVKAEKSNSFENNYLLKNVHNLNDLPTFAENLHVCETLTKFRNEIFGVF